MFRPGAFPDALRRVEITTDVDPLYQPVIVTAERKFWHCVECGEPLASLTSSQRSQETRPFELWICVPRIPGANLPISSAAPGNPFSIMNDQRQSRSELLAHLQAASRSTFQSAHDVTSPRNYRPEYVWRRL
jgi:hypothetical protein